MHSRNTGENNNNLKELTLLSDFKKSSPLREVTTAVENIFQSQRLKKASIDAISSHGDNLQLSNVLYMPEFTVDAVSSGKDNLQTAKFLSDLNEPDSIMKFATHFVEIYMQKSNKPTNCGEQNHSIGDFFKQSCKPGLQIQLVSNKLDSSLQSGVQLSSSMTNNLNGNNKIHDENLKTILKTNSSDEISLKEPPKKDANKLQSMVLRIFGWHWQSEKMFEYAFPLSKHANKLISGNIFHLLILFFKFILILFK